MSHNERYTYKSNDRNLSLTVAACGSLCLVRLRPQIDALSLLAWPQVSWASLVERQLLRDGGEKLTYVLACLCRCLKEEKSGFTCVLLSVGSGNRALVWRLSDQIKLVTGKGNNDIFVCLALEFFDPCFCLIERGL